MGDTEYGLGDRAADELVEPPEVAWRPPPLEREAPPIAVIGCGGIVEQHLTAYRRAGYRVVALCDPDVEAARAKRERFYPDADVYAEHEELLARCDVAVVDVATHADVRPPIVEAALRSGRHVLSQKPFALDLGTGQRLVELAEQQGLALAVNQNGRFAPHWAWLRAAVGAGLLGELASVDCSVSWNHRWVGGTPFDEMDHLVLFDFGIHWFDIACGLFGERRPERVVASARRAPGQVTRQPLLAEAAVDFEGGGRATLVFHGDSVHRQEDRTAVAGSAASALAVGPDLNDQRLAFFGPDGRAEPRASGRWFPDGFGGAMAELLSAVEQGREPAHGARANLRGLALAFAACASSLSGRAAVPGDVDRSPARGA